MSISYFYNYLILTASVKTPLNEDITTTKIALQKKLQTTISPFDFGVNSMINPTV